MSSDWVFSLGSNLGDRLGYLAAGIRGLQDAGVRVAAISSVYQSPPWGPVPQGPYLNVTVLGEADDSPVKILRRCHDVEAASGRVRDVRWGPRTLDIDLIAVGDRVEEGELLLPHPRAAERGFVLAGWAEIAPTAMLSGASVAALAASATDVVEIRPDLSAQLLATLKADG